MTTNNDIYPGRRISYDGALCTVRCKVNNIPGTRGEWLGVEWDDPLRGKHNGTHNGVNYFQCRSSQPTVASFVRPARRPDTERTILEAIRFKYVVDQSSDLHDPVIISGKVAEEIGFDKVIKAQSELANLKIVILDSLTICGVAPRKSDQRLIGEAQKELALACPNVVELDVSHNPIESWIDIEDICTALPKLRVLKLDIRFRDLVSASRISQNVFQNVKELHLNECLLSPTEVATILGHTEAPKFTALESLWLSQNELSNFNLTNSLPAVTFESVKTLMFENNSMKSLDPLVSILTVFPCASFLSLQSNQISTFGDILSSSEGSYPTVLSLNLSNNNIASFSFIDLLSQAFPSMMALRVSGNPVYNIQQSGIASSNRTTTSYYLTLARIPSLKSLNYTDITPREREQGEIYYLSVIEKEIRNALAGINTKDLAAAASTLTKQYQRYSLLCTKHDRENLILQLTSPISTTSQFASRSDANLPTHPPGSLASRLITSTFILTNSPSKNPTSNTKSFTREIPSTISTSSIFGLVSRELHLPALGFQLVYESDELDPLRDDTTTRSQLYADGKKGEERWDEWGDWDADAMVEMSIKKRKAAVETGVGDSSGAVAEGEGEGKWTDDGVLIKDGRKWKKREVDVLFGTRSWGDWLERGVKSCRIRVERVDRKNES